MSINDNTYYKVLGILSQKDKMLSLSNFNEVLTQLGLSRVSKHKFKSLMLDITKVGTPHEIYEHYAINEHSLDELLVTKNTFAPDNKGHKFTLTDSQISKLAEVVKSYSENHNGNVSLKQLFKRFDKAGISIPQSTELVYYLLDYDTKTQYLSDSKYNKSAEKSEIPYKVLKDESTRINMKQRNVQNLSRKYNALKRQVLDHAIIQEEVINALPNLNVKPVKIKKEDSAKGTLVVCLSDLHTGLKTEDFDFNTLAERLGKYLSYIISTVKYYRPSKIVLVSLGDIVENVYMHPTQSYEIEFPFSQQISKSISLITGFIQALVQMVKLPVEVRIIEGNHDRLTKDKKDNLFNDSASAILKYSLSAYQDQLGIKVIDDSLTRQHFNLNGTEIAITHGDYDKLNNKVLSKLSDYFDTDIKTVIGGHLHNLQINERGRNRYIIQSGAMFTGNGYSNSLGVASGATQVMLYANPKGKLNIIPIFLM